MHQHTPSRFCWTRFGVESGESVDGILRRKDAERVANGGIFLWGIGNSVGSAIRELVRLEKDPMVLFSPMRSKPRDVDANPTAVVAWTRGLDLEGNDWPLPQGSHVISRGSARIDRPKSCHYALVCESDAPLTAASGAESLVYEQLVNLVSQAKLGHSQVTAVVERKPDANCERQTAYDISFVARLVFPYIIKLVDPATSEEGYRRSRQGAAKRGALQSSLPGW